MSVSKINWSPAYLYKQAWKSIIHQPMLWVFGIIASGTSYNFNNSDQFDSTQFEQLLNQFQSFNPFLMFSQVLGTNSNQIDNKLIQLFSNLNPVTILILAISLVLFVLTIIILQIIFHAWSQACQIAGSNLALNLITHTPDQPKLPKLSLEQISTLAIPRIKPLIWLNIIPFLILLASLIAIIPFSIFAFFSDNLTIKVISALIALAGFGFFIHTLVLLLLIDIFASRQVVLDNFQPIKAIKTSYKLAKTYFWRSLLIGLLNMILTILLTGSLVTIPGAIFASLNQDTHPVMYVVVGLICIPIIIGTQLIIGAISSFKTSVWTLIYRQIT